MPSEAPGSSPGSPMRTEPPPGTSRSSRKRSRDESFNDSAVSAESRVPVVGPSSNRTGNLSLAVPLDRSASSFQNETGKWTQGQSGHPKPSLPDPQEPVLSAGAEQCQEERRKFQRQDAGPVSSTMHGCEAREDVVTTNRDPAEDSMSLELGVGWKSMSEDPDKRAAARGWAKFVERRFPLKTVTILAQHSSDCMLASALDGIYVFTPDLMEASLIARTWEGCVNELKATPITTLIGREGLQQIENPGFGESSGLRNADRQPVDSSSAESANDRLSTPSDTAYPTNPDLGGHRHDPNEEMVVD
ncbi:MAG: hypothetical protein LQ352_004337 [Teloschistes flavicans]|nr:MAG: hypothetical protein LQ352_004337 [Teloschistes flavicans]